MIRSFNFSTGAFVVVVVIVLVVKEEGKEGGLITEEGLGVFDWEGIVPREFGILVFVAVEEVVDFGLFGLVILLLILLLVGFFKGLIGLTVVEVELEEGWVGGIGDEGDKVVGMLGISSNSTPLVVVFSLSFVLIRFLSESDKTLVVEIAGTESPR